MKTLSDELLSEVAVVGRKTMESTTNKAQAVCKLATYLARNGIKISSETVDLSQFTKQMVDLDAMQKRNESRLDSTDKDSLEVIKTSMVGVCMLAIESNEQIAETEL